MKRSHTFAKNGKTSKESNPSSRHADLWADFGIISAKAWAGLSFYSGSGLAALTRVALRSGHHVVTANKALMAVEGEQLLSLATAYGVTLRYSAAVGGALPALERIDRARSDGPIRSFSGVLNGTTNFVLDQLAEGKDLASAVAAAQKAGHAEANPHFDLNGTDAAQKLILLARQAFGVCLPFAEVEREGIDQLDPQLPRKAHDEGQTVRLIASCRQEPDGLKASVKPLVLSLSHTPSLQLMT